jgi:hypothetical protein
MYRTRDLRSLGAVQNGGTEVGPTIVVMRLSERREERRARVIQMNIHSNNLRKQG